MSKWLRRALIAVLVLGALSAVIIPATLIYESLNPPLHTYSIPSDENLTESVAVAYTKRALIDDGKGATQLRPVPYWPESQFSAADGDAERLFARNSINPNSGYVIWSNGYHVTIEREGNTVHCRVFTPK